MTETETLREVLAILKDSGVTQASLKLTDLELAVVFPPQLPEVNLPPPPKPGGWKTLRDLDAPFDGESE